MDAIKNAIDLILSQEWLPYAGLIAFGVLGLFSDPPKNKEGQSHFKAAWAWIKGKLPQSAPVVSPVQKACQERKAVLLSLRHLASTLPADERTTALEVLDTVDLLNARVSERAEA